MADTIKRSLRIFLICLFGCTASSPWTVSRLPGSQKGFDSARLIYPAQDKVNGVAIEMVYANHQLRTYLSVHSQFVPPYRGNLKEALVTLKISDQVLQGIASRHEGGQRISLPSNLQEALIQALLQENSVTVELQGYSTRLSPEQFAAEYHKLKKNSLRLPIQLPFKL